MNAMKSDFTTQSGKITGFEPVYQRAFQLVKLPLILSLFITPIRFTLELYGAPENAIFLLGLLWLTLGFSVYWGITLYNQRNPYMLLLLSLVIYSPISRIPVSIIWWLESRFNFGTHYGLFFDNFPEAFLNQVIYGSLVQIIPGFVLGSITLMIRRYLKSR